MPQPSHSLPMCSNARTFAPSAASAAASLSSESSLPSDRSARASADDRARASLQPSASASRGGELDWERLYSLLQSVSRELQVGLARRITPPEHADGSGRSRDPGSAFGAYDGAAAAGPMSSLWLHGREGVARPSEVLERLAAEVGEVHRQLLSLQARGHAVCGRACACV
jgi:hypothetical protein